MTTCSYPGGLIRFFRKHLMLMWYALQVLVNAGRRCFSNRLAHARLPN